MNSVENLLPEFFLSLSILFSLVFGACLATSSYNYPLLNRNLTWMSVLMVGCMLGLVGINSQGWVGDFFVQDQLTLLTKGVGGLALLACLGCSQTWIRRSLLNSFEYFVLILLIFLGLCCLISSSDLLSLYLSLELQTLSFYILVGFQRGSAFSTEAALKYFLLGAISSGILLVGISCIYVSSGTCSLTNLTLLQGQQMGIIGWALFFMGLLFKLGVAPFHMWVADVYEGAPTSVTMLLATLPKWTIVTVFVVLLKASSMYASTWQYLLIGLGLMSILVGSFLGFAQLKTKRLLAYSGISHMGYVLLGFGCMSLFGLQSGVLYGLVYLCTSIYLWSLLMNLSEEAGRTRFLSNFLNTKQTNPWLSWASILVLFSLGGIPPLGGFFAKLSVFAATMDMGFYLAGVAGLLLSCIAMLYYLRLVQVLTLEKGPWGFQTLCLSRMESLWMGLVVMVLVFFVVFIDWISLGLTQALLI